MDELWVLINVGKDDDGNDSYFYEAVALSKERAIEIIGQWDWDMTGEFVSTDEDTRYWKNPSTTWMIIREVPR